jgi:opacity protein-like surface antigen
MKKTFLFLSLLLAFALSTHAQQVSDNAIGLRLGDNDGFGTEINYQRGLSENNRLEFGLSWHGHDSLSSFKFVGLYQWVWTLDGNFNWYVGAGGGVGHINFDSDFPGNQDDETFIFAAGDIGIEYNFNIPLLLSLDLRPEIGFGDYRNDFDFDLGLGIRYQF